MKRRHIGRRRTHPVFANSPNKVVGAGYLQALLAGDTELLDNFRRAFTADELLEAISEPFGLIVRYLGYHTEKTPTEIGDALVRAVNQTRAETA